MNIDAFIETAKKEYATGAYDKARVPLGDFTPQIMETQDYLAFYLEEVSGTLFSPEGKPQDTQEAPQALNLSKWSFAQYCRRIKPEGAPLTADYIKDCSPTLATHNLTTWARVNAEKEVYARFKKEENGRINVRALLSGTWAPIDALYVASKLHKFLGKDPIDFVITEKFWRILRWTGGKQPYEIGFRIMGSEVGAMPHLRVDTVIGFPIGDTTHAIVPILKNGKPVGRMTYNSSGSKASNKLIDSIHKGLSQADELTSCLDLRAKEPLKYPQDEFIDIVDDRNLPAGVRAAVSEREKLFIPVKNKLDMVKLLSTLAGEATGFAQIKIEEAAALYALTGKSRDRVNRNDEAWEGA